MRTDQWYSTGERNSALYLGQAMLETVVFFRVSFQRRVSTIPWKVGKKHYLRNTIVPATIRKLVSTQYSGKRQIHLLIYDVPGYVFEYTSPDVHEVSWKFIVPYTDDCHLVTSTFCGLWVNQPLEHLQCHMKTLNSECFELLECSKYFIIHRIQLREKTFAAHTRYPYQCGRHHMDGWINTTRVKATKG